MIIIALGLVPNGHTHSGSFSVNMRSSHEVMINASSRPFAEAELNQPTYNNDKRWQADHVSENVKSLKITVSVNSHIYSYH